jgi:hypothetical protein
MGTWNPCLARDCAFLFHSAETLQYLQRDLDFLVYSLISFSFVSTLYYYYYCTITVIIIAINHLFHKHHAHHRHYFNFMQRLETFKFHTDAYLSPL